LESIERAVIVIVIIIIIIVVVVVVIVVVVRKLQMGNSFPRREPIPTQEDEENSGFKIDFVDQKNANKLITDGFSSIPENIKELEEIDVDHDDGPLRRRKFTIEDAIFVNSGVLGQKRALTYSPVAPDNSPTILTFANLTVATKGSASKILLKDISGNITGGLWAIMGSSGSGKTTLLSALSLRLDPSYMEISGEFRLNGRAYSRAMLKTMSAYVMQDDLLHAELTVAETMYYAAQLRMSAALTDAERMVRIDEVLTIMGIEHTKNVIIGNTRRKGISGGERKRVCVAIELLNRPKLLFLDEPTSGLDSSTAYSVCKALKHLSDIGECTVICTIHQPQPKIYRLFDNLVLMKQGNIVYQGNSLKVVAFLENIDTPCPVDENLADHLLNVVATTGNSQSKGGGNIEDHKLQVPVDLTLGIEKPLYTQEGARSWFREYTILSRRCFKQYFRQWELMVMTLIVTVLIAVFIGFGFWKDCGNDPKRINLIRASCFFAMVNQGVSASLQTIIAFPAERAIVLRERQAGAYRVSSYFMAKTTCDLITLLWPSILFAAIVYHSVGYQPSARKFGIYMLFCVLDTYAATSLCAAVVCICVSIDRSTVVLSFLFEITRLFGGYYTSPRQLHEYPHWKWADALSYLKYAYIGAVLPLLRGVKGSQAIIDLYEYDAYTVGECAGYIIVLIIGFRFLAYLGLRFIKA
jgi:ATP-binding cassette subfamily G (WHITE) protein 2